MIPGISLELAGTTYVVPPLSLGSIELFEKRISSFKGTAADAGIVVDVLHHALARNYPTVSRKQVCGSLKLSDEGDIVENIPALVGLENMQEVFEACMDVSGIKRKALEAAASGEAPAV